MESTFHLEIISPEKVVYRGAASSLVVPAEYGYMGILAHHAPLVAHLVRGKIIVRDEAGKVETLQTSGGFMEVSRNQATVVLDTYEGGKDGEA